MIPCISFTCNSLVVFSTTVQRNAMVLCNSAGGEFLLRPAYHTVVLVP